MTLPSSSHSPPRVMVPITSKGLGVRGGDELLVAVLIHEPQTSSSESSHAGGFIGEAEHGRRRWRFSCCQCVGHGSEEIYCVMVWRVESGNLAGQ
jgi:hypothetical protein